MVVLPVAESRIMLLLVKIVVKGMFLVLLVPYPKKLSLSDEICPPCVVFLLVKQYQEILSLKTNLAMVSLFCLHDFSYTLFLKSSHATSLKGWKACYDTAGTITIKSSSCWNAHACAEMRGNETVIR